MADSVEEIAVEALSDALSSLRESVGEAAMRQARIATKDIFRADLDGLVASRSTLRGSPIKASEVTMSPLILSVKACHYSLGRATGTTWVVCAPVDQGKSLVSQFLIHGDHYLRPERALTIHATNITNFAKDFAAYMDCEPAESEMSQFLYEVSSARSSAPRHRVTLQK